MLRRQGHTPTGKAFKKQNILVSEHHLKPTLIKYEKKKHCYVEASALFCYHCRYSLLIQFPVPMGATKQNKP